MTSSLVGSEMCIRDSFCSHQPKKWLQWLPWAEWHYNTTFHTSSKLTPYEVVYGQPPPAVPTYESGTTKVDLVDRSLQERGRILSQLKTNLVSAQVRMKQHADKHRSERSFEVGDMVFLRLVPYQHQSLATHPFISFSHGFMVLLRCCRRLVKWLIKLTYLPHQNFTQFSMFLA